MGKSLLGGSGIIPDKQWRKKMSINRRSFIQTAAAVTASLSAPMVMANGGNRELLSLEVVLVALPQLGILLRTAKVQLT